MLESLRKDYEERADQAEGNGENDRAASLRELAGLTLYRRGLNMIDWAGVDKDRDYRYEQALDALTDFQWSLEDEKLIQYYAMHNQGIVQRLLGKTEEATDLQREVLERGQWYWDNQRVDPDSGARNEAVAPYISELMDRAWGELARDLLDAGDPTAANAVIDGMLDAHAKGKEPFGRPGWQVLLAWADTLAEIGRTGRAAELVKMVAEGAGNVPEGDIARQRLGSLVAESGAGVVESAGVLVAAARGLVDQARWDDAAWTWLRAAAVSGRNDADRKQFSVDSWLGAGRALTEQRRYLEAALAYTHGLDEAVALDKPDDLREYAGFQVYSSYDRRYKETTDAFDKKLRDDARDRLIKLGYGENLQFQNAREVFDEAAIARPQDPKRYTAALDELRAVPQTAPDYERSLVYVGRALTGLGRTDDALAAFDVMLARADDRSLAPVSSAARQRRDNALGEALYYKATLLLDPAVNRPADALGVLEGFEAKLPGPAQASLVESVKYQRVVAWSLLGKFEEAEAAWNDLNEFRPESPFLAVAAFRVSEAVLAASNAARDAGDVKAADALLHKAADFMWLYNERSGFPSYANLQNCGQWYLSVGDDEAAQKALSKALEKFGKDKDVTAEQLDQTRIGLATSYNRQKEFNRARPYWQDLAKRRPRDPVVMRGAALCYGGWLEPAPDGTIVEVPGSGDYADALKLWSDLHQGLSANKYRREWWESKLNAIYTLYREGTANPTSLEQARKVLDGVKALTPNYDQDTMSNLEPDKRYEDLLRPLFKYLEKKIPER